MFLLRTLGASLGRRPLFVTSSFHSSAIWNARAVKPFLLADIGEGITECEVIKWSVKPSSSVQAFDPLCEVQSDKASVEITSPFDGVVKDLLVKEGEVAKVGEGLCLIEVDEEVAAEVDHVNEQAQPTSSSPPSPKPAAETTVQQVAPDPQPSQTTPQRRPHPLDPNAPKQQSFSPGNNADVLATPSVRHFARQNNIDLCALAPGSGKNGRIERKDVEDYLAGARPSAGASSTSAPQPQVSADDVVVELGRTRFNMWKAMVRSLEIPHFGYSTYLDITALHSLLPRINESIPPHFLPESARNARPLPVDPSALYPAPSTSPVPETAQFTRLTYLPFMLKTLSKAMYEWPLFRSSITAQADASGNKPTLTVRPHADISIALSTPTGLYTPTLQKVDTHSVYSIASQLRHVSHLGRLTPCGLTPTEMPKKGGTLTVSNVGAIGAGEFASPVLVPGTGVAIVAIGRAKWVRDEERDGERRLKVGVSWSADHRVVEGAELAAFVECWRSWIEHPERMIADAV